MAATFRLVSTGELNTPLCEVKLTHSLEKFLWLYLKQCEASTVSGFYPLSLGKTAFETGIPMPHIIEILAKLEQLQITDSTGSNPAIVYDDDLIFIPTLTAGLKLSNSALAHHIDAVVKRYSGRPDNRAWQAFQQQFCKTPEKPTIPRSAGRFAGKTAKSANNVNGSQTRQTAGVISANRGPNEPIPSEDATFADVLDYFVKFRTVGRGLACPSPIEDQADEFFKWICDNARDDWKYSAAIWIQNLLKSDHKDIATYESGLVLTESGVRLRL